MRQLVTVMPSYIFSKPSNALYIPTAVIVKFQIDDVYSVTV